jgi:hypothetical protein
MDDATIYISIGSLLVAIGSLVVSLAAYLHSRQARQEATEHTALSPLRQARQDATERTALSPSRQAGQEATEHIALSRRTEAINHLRKAQSDIRKAGVVNPIAIESMRAAKGLAEVVFNDEVRGKLDRIVDTAERLHRERVKEGTDPGAQAMNALLSDLRSLIVQMNYVAALR